MKLIASCIALDCRKMLISDRDDQADHAHDQEGAEARQVLLRRVAPEAEADERRRRREEGRRDRRAGEDQEDRGHRQAHHRRERPEEQLRGSGRQPVDAEAQHHHERERREHDHIFQDARAAEDRRPHSRCWRTAARRCRSAARPTPCNCRPTACRTAGPRRRRRSRGRPCRSRRCGRPRVKSICHFKLSFDGENPAPLPIISCETAGFQGKPVRRPRPRRSG
jgi:hypothetical protein